MRKWVVVLLLAEIAILALLAMVLMRSREPGAASPALAAGAGLLVMGGVSVPAIGLVQWGRKRSGAGLIGAVTAGLLGKMALVGLSVWYALTQTSLSAPWFVVGLGAGWLVALAAQGFTLASDARAAHE